METYRHDDVEITKGYANIIKSWTVGVEVEDHAKAQLANVANLPFIFRHVAVMPDVHAGMGATIGSVIPTKGAIVPSAVGVDIGCGMIAHQTTLTKGMLPNDLAALRKAIESAVPHGYSKGRDKGSWGDVPAEVNIAWMGLEGRYRKIIEKHPKISHKVPANQLGTLGTGNHFIEVTLDENDQVWIVLHSGSRGPGNRVGEYFIRLAKGLMEQYFIKLPDPSLAYLPEGTDAFDDYIEAVHWCQQYASTNRELMMDAVIKAMKRSKLVPKFEADKQVVNCHHNYVARENHYRQNIWVTRKGAVSARKGQLGIIPGSMGAKSYIVSGLGNPESFNSCSHGAGRLMSRTAAKKTFTLKDHREATKGIECRQDSSVLDETPGAYKDIDTVMEAQKTLVEPVHTLRQVICVKG